MFKFFHYKKPWVSFSVDEINYIIGLILDYGESVGKNENLAGELFSEIESILKFHRKIYKL